MQFFWDFFWREEKGISPANSLRFSWDSSWSSSSVVKNVAIFGQELSILSLKLADGLTWTQQLAEAYIKFRE